MSSEIQNISNRLLSAKGDFLKDFNPKYVWSLLVSKKVITFDECQALREMSSTQDQVEKLFEFLVTKGSVEFSNFIKVLEAEDDYGVNYPWLAEKLMETSVNDYEKEKLHSLKECDRYSQYTSKIECKNDLYIDESKKLPSLYVNHEICELPPILDEIWENCRGQLLNETWNEDYATPSGLLLNETLNEEYGTSSAENSNKRNMKDSPTTDMSNFKKEEAKKAKSMNKLAEAIERSNEIAQERNEIMRESNEIERDRNNIYERACTILFDMFQHFLSKS